jgi:hypothetical protein
LFSAAASAKANPDISAADGAFANAVLASTIEANLEDERETGPGSFATKARFNALGAGDALVLRSLATLSHEAAVSFFVPGGTRGALG